MNRLPTEEGVYWYEFADYPVIVKRIDKHDYNLCAFIREWILIEKLREGWWSSPLKKPVVEPPSEEEQIHDCKVMVGFYLTVVVAAFLIGFFVSRELLLDKYWNGGVQAGSSLEKRVEALEKAVVVEGGVEVN